MSYVGLVPWEHLFNISSKLFVDGVVDQSNLALLRIDLNACTIVPKHLTIILIII
jgi:hypothetical protein